jgi:hypothetical protein
MHFETRKQNACQKCLVTGSSGEAVAEINEIKNRVEQDAVAITTFCELLLGVLCIGGWTRG